MDSPTAYIQPTGPATPITIHPDALAYLKETGDKVHAEEIHTSIQNIPAEHRPTVIDPTALHPEITGDGEAIPYKKTTSQTIQIKTPPASGVTHIMYGLSHWLGNTIMNNSDIWEKIHESRLQKLKHPQKILHPV